MYQPFIRIEVPGIMTYWMGDTELIRKNPLGHAVIRVKATTSSVISSRRRVLIDPGNHQRLANFVDAVSRRDAGISVTQHVYKGGVRISTKELNEQELYAAVAKQVPVYTPNSAAAYEFRKECTKSLKP